MVEQLTELLLKAKKYGVRIDFKSHLMSTPNDTGIVENWNWLNMGHGCDPLKEFIFDLKFMIEGIEKKNANVNVESGQICKFCNSTLQR